MPINLSTLSSLPHILLQLWPEDFVYVCLHSVKHSPVASMIMRIPVITKASSLADTLASCSPQSLWQAVSLNRKTPVLFFVKPFWGGNVNTYSKKFNYFWLEHSLNIGNKVYMSSIISFTPAVGWAQLHCCPASSRFCNSAITVHGSFMCNELVITVFPLGPVLASHFHLKAALAHMSTDAERLFFFFTCLKFTSVVQSNCCLSVSVLKSLQLHH